VTNLSEPHFDTLVGSSIRARPRRVRVAIGQRLERTRARAAFLTGMLTLSLGLLLLMASYFAPGGLPSIFPILNSASETASLQPSVKTALDSGPVVFWDDATVTCALDRTVTSISTGATFSCDWTTFARNSGGPLYSPFQRREHITVGVFNHQRVVAALILGDPSFFADSYQPSNDVLRLPSETWAPR
jgi:hypothetical protein